MAIPTTVSGEPGRGFGQPGPDARTSGASALDTARRSLMDALHFLDAAGERTAHTRTTAAVASVDDALTALADGRES